MLNMLNLLTVIFSAVVMLLTYRISHWIMP